MSGSIYVGCAGWSLRREHFSIFPEAGSHLQRYSARFNCVEINSSFYRSHRVSTYQRWAEATPSDFRFSVKLPKQITHVNRLRDSQDAIAQFSAEVGGLGPKLGAVLVQLPPSCIFDRTVAAEFFNLLTTSLVSPIVVEPRHASWFEEKSDSFLAAWSVGRAAADPAVTPAASEPHVANILAYYRWHGSPRTYYSSYSESMLSDLAQRLASAAKATSEVWCVFDNTAEGAATVNALLMQELCSRALAAKAAHATR